MERPTPGAADPAGQGPPLPWRLLFASPLYRFTLGGAVPAEVRGTPPDPWPGNAAAAVALFQGQLVDGARRTALPAGPWDGTLDRRAAAVLHGFGWLRDARALGGEEAHRTARAWTAEWIARHGTWSAAWAPERIGARIANWLMHYGFLANGADAAFTAALRDSAARQVRHLMRVAARWPAAEGRFAAAKGLVFAGLCLPGLDRAFSLGLKLLGREIAARIQPDGGHAERNPQIALATLADLIEIRGALAAAHAEIPIDLANAIDRMAPWLRMLRHGDGRLALFHDGAEGDERTIGAVLAHASARGKALGAAPHSGFYRLAAGRTVVVMDGGPPPPAPSAHASALAFEMSVGRDRLVVNCGSRAHDGPAWAQALRATAAHSTAAVDDGDSAPLGEASGKRSRPLHVAAVRREVDGHQLIEASHDGYAAAFGLVHRRLLFLAPEGTEVRGEDTLEAAGGTAGGHRFAVRFHLHPRVQASLLADGETVLLRLPSDQGWRFRARGGRIEMAESVYCGDGATVRRCQQIIVTGTIEGSAQVKWRIAREDGRG